MSARLRFLCTMLLFGSIGLFVRHIALPSGTIAFVRGVVGVLVLLLFSLAARRPLARAALRQNLALLLLSGAAVGVNWICLFEAYRRTTIAVATLAYYLAPVFVCLLSPLVLRERLSPLRALCVALSLLGMALVAGVFTQVAGAAVSLPGVLFGLAAAACYAAVMLMNRFLKGIDGFSATVAQLAAASAVLLPYVLLAEGLPAALPDAKTLLLLAVVGVVYTGLAYYFYFSSLAQIPAQTAAILSYIDPVTAILLSALLLHEPLSIAQIIGAALILGSALVSERWGNGRKPKAALPEDA